MSNEILQKKISTVGVVILYNLLTWRWLRPTPITRWCAFKNIPEPVFAIIEPPVSDILDYSKARDYLHGYFEVTLGDWQYS